MGEHLYYKFVENVNVPDPSGSSRAKIDSEVRDAMESDDARDDQTHAKQIEGVKEVSGMRTRISRAQPLPCRWRCGKVATWEDADTSAGGEEKLISFWVFACVVSERLAPGGPSMFVLYVERSLPRGGASRVCLVSSCVLYNVWALWPQFLLGRRSGSLDIRVANVAHA